MENHKDFLIRLNSYDTHTKSQTDPKTSNSNEDKDFPSLQIVSPI